MAKANPLNTNKMNTHLSILKLNLEVALHTENGKRLLQSLPPIILSDFLDLLVCSYLITNNTPQPHQLTKDIQLQK